MDFDRNLSKIQGALISFPNIDSDDEKDKILSQIFSSAKESEKPKMVFFLILNTDFGVPDKVIDDGSIGLLMDVCPHLELNFLTTIILDLKLTHCLYDIVSNCPLTLSVKLLQILYNKLDNCKSEPYGLSRIICGIIEKLFKVSKAFHSDSLGFSALYEMGLKYLNTLIDTVEKKEKSKSNLSLLNFWLNKFLNYIKLSEADCGRLSDNPIFKMYYERDENDNENEAVSGFEFSKYLYCMCDGILGEFSKILRNCDELDVDESLLKSICENACRLHEKISDHPLGLTLEGIMKKLETKSSVTSEMDINDIISKMKNDKSACDLFKSVVKYPNAFENEDAIICMVDHLNLADSNDLKYIIESIEELSEKSEQLQTLYFSSLRKLNLDDQLTYLRRHFESGRCFSNGESPTFALELTEKFNKLSDDVYNPVTMSCLIAFSIRSPLKTIVKICEEAVSNGKRFPLWFDSLVMLKSACLSGQYPVEGCDGRVNCISYAAYVLIDRDILDEKEKRLSTKLITQLCKGDILDIGFVTTLIANVARREIAKAKLTKVVFVLDLLKAFLRSKSLPRDKHVMMAFMSQILSHASWDCKSFSPQLAKVREIVIWIVNHLIKNSHFTEGPEIIWLHQKLMKSSDINVLYFCDLWFSLDFAFVTSNELHIQLLILLHTKCKIDVIVNKIIKKFEAVNLGKFENQINAALVKILPILTAKEWTSLFAHLKLIIASLSREDSSSSDETSLKVFELFKNSMYIAALCVNQDGDTAPCFEFCTRNFGRIIQQNLLSEDILTLPACRELLIGLLFVLNGIRDVECRKLNSLILSPIVFDLINRLEERSESLCLDDEIRKLKTWFKANFV